MIIWLTGNTGAGKTTLAKQLVQIIPNAILLDGDDIRNAMDNTDMSKKGREENNVRIARLAYALQKQNYSNHIIVSVICPYRYLRGMVYSICNCKFVYVKGGKEGEDFPYEIPDNTEEYISYSIDWRI